MPNITIGMSGSLTFHRYKNLQTNISSSKSFVSTKLYLGTLFINLASAFIREQSAWTGFTLHPSPHNRVKCNHVQQLYSFTKLTINHLTGAVSLDWTLLWGICVLDGKGKVVCAGTFRSFQTFYWCNFVGKISTPPFGIRQESSTSVNSNVELEAVTSLSAITLREMNEKNWVWNGVWH